MRRLIDSSKTKLVLLIIFVLVVVAFVVFLFLNHGNKADTTSSVDTSDKRVELLDKKSDDKDKGQQIFMMPKDEVYKFSMTDADGIFLNFLRKGNEWVYEDDDTLDINEDRIDKILNYLTNIYFVDSLNVDDAEEYGLSQESRMFILTDGSGYETIISLGDKTDDGQIYFAINYDFNNIYINSGKLSNVGDYYIEDLVGF
jgi:hypothetical protein